MSDDARRNRDVAVSLMRMALPLLDRADQRIAAARLQHAIDSVSSPIDAGPSGEPVGPAVRSEVG